MHDEQNEDEQIAQSVRRHGWHCIFVEANDADPALGYSVGLATRYDHPELAVIGLDAKTTHWLISNALDAIRGGTSLERPTPMKLRLDEQMVAFRRIHPSHHDLYFGYAMGHIRHVGHSGPLAVVQILWPDKNGRFPFESECAPEVVALQRALHLPAKPSERRDFRERYGLR